MRHQHTNRISFFEPELCGGFDAPIIHSPMFFVGIQREMAPPICFGQSRFQRMRIIFVEPERAKSASETAGEPPFEVLPPLPALPHFRALQPRLVNGEILRGENDEFYERIGNRIRRLRTLAAGPNGEVIDIAHSEPTNQQQNTRGFEQASIKPENASSSDVSPSFRRLLPEPGQWCVVPFGGFRQMLAPQLAHPERLRDVHRVACHANVFEVTVQQPLEQLARAILGDLAAGQLQLLTPAIVIQLQLGSLLPPQLHPGARAPGIVFPGDRVFHLRLTNDPTADEAVPPNHASAQSLKTKIPEAFVRSSEFHISREEALYDLSFAFTFLGSLGSKLRRLAHFVAFRRELRKWQMLLNGKSADEQLWSVRPPHRGLTHRLVRAWAKSALQLAGYDSRNMLIEWQVFWKRKGI